MVRVVSDVIDQMKISQLTQGYKGGGTSSYHPKMMLKVLVYAYTQRIYSCRQIAKTVRENIYYMWLAGQNQPDFRTINRFRSSRLKSTVQDVITHPTDKGTPQGGSISPLLSNIPLDDLDKELGRRHAPYPWDEPEVVMTVFVINYRGRI